MLHKCTSPASFVLEMNTVHFLSSVSCPEAIWQETQSVSYKRVRAHVAYSPLSFIKILQDLKCIPSHTK